MFCIFHFRAYKQPKNCLKFENTEKLPTLISYFIIQGQMFMENSFFKNDFLQNINIMVLYGNFWYYRLVQVQVNTSYYRLLQITIGYYRLLQVTTGYYRLLQITIGCYMLLQVTLVYYRLVQITTGYYRLLKVTTD